MSCNKLHVSFVKLRDICDISSGQNAPQNNEDYCPQGFTFIKASDLESVINDDNENNTTKIAKSAITKYKLKQFPEQSVVFAKSGLSCKKNRIYVTKKATFVVNHLCVLSNFSSNFLPNWIALFLKEFNVTRLIKDDSYPSIKLSDIGNIDIPVIDKAKQGEKVSEIESICSTIRNKKKQILNFDSLVKSRFIEMFGDADFKSVKISEMIDKKKISAKKTYRPTDEIKYIDISSIDNQNHSIANSTNVIFGKAPSRAQQCLKKNDILISTVRPNLKNIAMLSFPSDNYVGSSGFCVLRPLKCNPLFLKYIVLSDDFTNAMIKLTNGANYPAIKNQDVLNYEMIDVPINFQNQFAAFVELVDKSRFDQIQEKVRISPISDRIKSA